MKDSKFNLDLQQTKTPERSDPRFLFWKVMGAKINKDFEVVRPLIDNYEGAVDVAGPWSYSFLGGLPNFTKVDKEINVRAQVGGRSMFRTLFEEVVGLTIDDPGFDQALRDLSKEEKDKAWQKLAGEIHEITSEFGGEGIPELDKAGVSKWLGLDSLMANLTDASGIIRSTKEFPEYDQSIMVGRERKFKKYYEERKGSEGGQQEAEGSPPVIRVEEDADVAVFENIWGESEWKEALFKMIPNDFLFHLNNITFHDSFGVLTDSDGVDFSPVARWVASRKEIQLATKESSAIGGMIYSILHELGHAIDESQKPLRGVKIRKRFLEAVRKKPNMFSSYALKSYERSIKTGLSEDFAESFASFFYRSDLLREQNPERYEAMEEIMKEFYPDVDVESARQAISGRSRQLYDYINYSGPDKLRKLLKGQPLTVLTFFPSQILRYLDHTMLRGEPNTESKRLLGEGNVISHEYGDNGGILKESFIMADGEVVVTLEQPSHDNLGRLVEYHNSKDKIKVLIHYQGEEEIPEKIEIINEESGEGKYIVYLEKKGKSIFERSEMVGFPIKKTTVQYDLDESGKITQVIGNIAGEPVFKRQFSYDERGRIVGKSIESHDGDLVKQLNYEYE